MDKECSIKNKIHISNVQTICRICLSKYDKMISLLTTKENTLLLDMFASVTSIKVQIEDGLPLQICELCETKVVSCYRFKIRCKKSNSILKSLIRENENDTKNNLNNTVSSIEECIEKEIINTCEDANLTDGHQGNNEEIDVADTSADVKLDDVKVSEIEYLEDGIFERMEDEEQKKNHEHSLTNTGQKTLATQHSFTGLTEKIKQKPQSKKGKRKYYTCSICSKKFLKAKTLKLHVCKSHGAAREAHACAHCRDTFSCEQDLHIHSALHGGAPWQCNQCHKEFQERGKLRRHVRRHMAGKRHACERCGKRFAERCALRRHARVHTGQPPDKRHECHVCDKRYSSSAALAAHVLRHAGERPCACDACGKAFPSPRLLASHRRVHDERKPHACRYCDKRFRHESTRNTHHRTHTGERPYVCCACGKRFIQNSNLTLHMRTHTGEKPYSCDSCERKFSSGSALASHRRTHTGEKPYGCPVCGKRFARVYLSSHMRQHTGERPFTCCVCAKSFANAARLRQHHLIHTGEKPFECAMCSQKFKTKGYLAKHLKNHEMIKNLEKQNMLVMDQVDKFRSCVVDKDGQMTLSNVASPDDVREPDKDNITVEVTEEMPLEVSGELILPNDGHVKTEFVVINGEGHDNICLRASGGSEDTELNYANLVTVNEGLVEIHTSGGQVTISKITSKMTANF